MRALLSISSSNLLGSEQIQISDKIWGIAWLPGSIPHIYEKVVCETDTLILFSH